MNQFGIMGILTVVNLLIFQNGSLVDLMEVNSYHIMDIQKLDTLISTSLEHILHKIDLLGKMVSSTVENLVISQLGQIQHGILVSSTVESSPEDIGEQGFSIMVNLLDRDPGSQQ